MTAFINGAISALKKCLSLIDKLDPEGTNVDLMDLKNQINIYITMYKTVGEQNINNKIKDETWNNILKTTSLTEKEKEELEEIKDLICEA